MKNLKYFIPIIGMKFIEEDSVHDEEVPDLFLYHILWFVTIVAGLVYLGLNI